MRHLLMDLLAITCPRSLAWTFDPDATKTMVDGDFSKPLLEDPSPERTAHMRFVIKFSLDISLKHNSAFALVEEDEYGKPTTNVLAATCLVPPNNKNLHDPGICEMFSIVYRIKKPPSTIMSQRMDAVGAIMKKGHQKWASDPHWYVFCFAANHEKQGKGYGRTLMEFICSLGDASNLNLYLETHGPRNRRFYERNGYAVMEQMPIEGGKNKDNPFSMHGGGLAMLRTPKV